MKATEYVAQQLLRETEPYGARFAGQLRPSVTARIPVELVAWLDVLKAKGLGDTRSAVLQVLMDVAIEQILQLGVCGDASDLSDIVEARKEQLEVSIEESK